MDLFVNVYEGGKGRVWYGVPKTCRMGADVAARHCSAKCLYRIRVKLKF